MTFSQFLAILRARWKIVVSITALAVLTTMAINKLMPNRYSANAVVMVDIKTPDPVAGMVLPGLMAPTFMTTQADVATSQRVLDRVIRNLQLENDPRMQAMWAASGSKDSFKLWLAAQLRQSLKVSPSRESNVIDIAYLGDSPEAAARMANSFARAYIDVTAELRAEPARAFGASFETLAAQLRARLEKASEKLTRYQKDAGLMSTDERLDVETSKLADLSSQVLQLEAMAKDGDVRLSAARARGADNTTESTGSTVIASLKTQLAGEETQLQEIKTRLGDAHPTVQQQEAAVQNLRKRLDNELARVTSQIGNSSSIASGRLAAARIALEDQRVKLLKLKEQRAALNLMVRDVENLQRAYDVVQARVSQATMEASSTQTNLSIIQEAQPPLSPASPKSVLNTIVALVLGTLLACATAIGVELIDRRVRSNEDIIRQLGMPLVGVLLKTENAPKGLLTRRAPPWIIHRTLPSPSGNN